MGCHGKIQRLPVTFCARVLSHGTSWSKDTQYLDLIVEESYERLLHSFHPPYTSATSLMETRRLPHQVGWHRQNRLSHLSLRWDRLD